MQNFCFFNGKIVKEDEAKISLRDIGLLRGYGIFESLKTYAGKPFLLKKHYERLKKSAKELNINIPISERKLSNVINQLIAKNHLNEASIKIVLTGGVSSGGLKFNSNSPTFFVLTEKLHGLSNNIYNNGVKLITQKFLRSLPEIKSTNYLEAISKKQQLKKEGAFEFLFINNDEVLESSTGNFFMFLKNELVTPRENILHGVTRDFVLKIASKKFKIKERKISKKELFLANECFITGSHKEIVPVVQIDNKKINDGKVGPKTKNLMKEFRQATKTI